MKEQLKLVTNFDDLRAGMIVVYIPCGICACRHRVMLTTKLDRPNAFDVFTGKVGRALGWKYVPAMPCDAPGVVNILLTDAVERGAVYRVIDGLEQSQTTKKRKSVRA